MTLPKLTKVVLNSVDVSTAVVDYEIKKSYTKYISEVTINFGKKLENLLTVQNSLVGSSVTIQRGVSSSTEKYVFRGEIRNITFDGGAYRIVCYDKLYEAIRTKVTYTYDKNIDDEAGVISEIFKDLINTYTSLTADDTSVQNSGTVYTLDKFFCRDAFVFERISDLAKSINWQFYYDPVEDKVFFEPKGYTSSTTIFEVSENITEIPKWTFNSDQLANQITVRGAEQLVETTEFFDGDGTDDQTVTLSKTPFSVKVYVGSGSYDPTGTGTRPSDNEGTLKSGGKTGSTSGDYYYSYDQDSKVRRIDFGSVGNLPSGIPASGTNNIEVRYTYSLPVPIVGRNQDSIDTYGLHEKVIVKSDIKNVSDAEVYMQKQLDKYSDVFATTTFFVINESDIDIGRVYNVIDNINGINDDFLVSEHVLYWPNGKGDKVTVGDELWKTDDWDIEVWDRLKRLEEQQTETTDLLVDVRQFSKNILYERRYMLVEHTDRSGDGANTFILGHPTFGILGTQELGDGNGGASTYSIIQGNNTYKEFLYDEVFKGSGTATWNTGTEEITFTSGQTMTTSQIALGPTYTYFTVTLASLTGSVLVEISADNGSSWQTVTLASRTLFSSSDGTGVLLRFTEDNTSTATIANTYDIFDNYDEPAIKVLLEE